MAILKILLLSLMLLLNACMYYPHHLYEGYGRSYYDRGYGNYHENHYHGNGSHGYGRGQYHGNWRH
jgi:starvation-inducible outer membrane lipoprotein